jgi:hypothetical protein
MIYFDRIEVVNILAAEHGKVLLRFATSHNLTQPHTTSDASARDRAALHCGLRQAPDLPQGPP